ncbi:MAG: hypothetical protein QF864_06225 [SAR202 cluster bacterium]|jgi:hypothetical protein|nr:hypothetical protein [SAR202 cluster bacterium]
MIKYIINLLIKISKKIKKLNAALKIKKLVENNIPRYKGKTKVFTMKMGRKTLETQIVRKNYVVLE